MRIEVRFTGSGGQGLVLASRVLASAEILESKNVLQSQVYGAEARGGATKSEVIISDEEIFFPGIVIPDILVIMTDEAYKKYGAKLKEHGTMILDSSMVKSYKSNNSFIVYMAPFTEIANNKFNSKILANMIALGFTIKVLGLIRFESVVKALSAVFKGETFEINVEALRAGQNLDIQSLKS